MEQHDDDKPLGRVLSRREMLALLGGAGAAFVVGAGCSPSGQSQPSSTTAPTIVSTSAATTAATTVAVLPDCVVIPALTEGPYFVDDQLNRSDIRVEPSDDSIKEGALLRLTFRVSDVSTNGCTPIEGAQFDLWHCDAAGVYSGVTDPGFDTSGQKWLRGYQVTDEDGVVEFTTIYPGWYSSRAVHMHFKIRTDPTSEQGYEFTSQFFFDDELTDMVHAEAPYAAKGMRDTLNADDSIFQGSEGLLTLNVEEAEDGYRAGFHIGLDLSQPASSDAGGAPPGGIRPSG
jgi:protocatechuate 3,4-dioxygenase beta subunit